MSHFTKILESLMNDDETTAYRLFHEFVIESSKAIYEDNKLDEYLTPDEEAEVAKWNKRTPQATQATNHFFGGDEIEDIYRPLVDLDGKSEVHAAIEQDIGIPISSDDYKKGMVKDKSGKQIRISSAISDPKLRTAFKTDPLRKGQPTKAASRNVRITRSPTGVAGQTSHGQSWEGYSCKNFNDGVNKRYLCHEVENGTVVAYLTDKESGEEIARGTFQPYTNEEGNYLYRLDAYYGENNAQFKKYLKQLERELSQPHSGSPVYNIHRDVYNDSGVQQAITPNANYEDYENIVSQDGMALQYVPEESPEYEKICKIAVSQNGDALRYVPKDLPEYLEICEIAVGQGAEALELVPEKLRTPEICKIAVSQNGRALYYVPYKLRTPEICKIAVSQNGKALLHVPEELPEYAKLRKIAVGQNGKALGDVAKKLRTPELCKIAVSQDGEALQWVPEELPEYADICKIAVGQNGWALDYVPRELPEYADICKIAVGQNGWALDYVPKELRTQELCKAAVSQNSDALRFVPPELKDEVKRAVEQEKQQQ
jgi:exosome complex RNA-binding protein Rrp4